MTAKKAAPVKLDVSPVVTIAEDGRRWKGPEVLVPFLVPIADLTPNPSNPRIGDVGAIAASLERFGQMRLAVVEEDGTLLVGNHMREAALERLGWTHLAVLPPGLSDDDAGRYLIADNRTSDLARYDDAQLASMLAEFRDDGSGGSGLEGTGYAEDDVDELMARVQRELDAAGGTGGGGGGGGDAGRGGGGVEGNLKQVQLLFNAEQHERFGNFVRMLAKEHGTDGVTATVYTTLERAARAL